MNPWASLRYPLGDVPNGNLVSKARLRRKSEREPQVVKSMTIACFNWQPIRNPPIQDMHRYLSLCEAAEECNEVINPCLLWVANVSTDG